MKYKHSHPINIIEHTSKYLILLVFPALRALFLSGQSLTTWLKGTWFDLIVVSIILFLGFLAWYKYVYHLSDNGLFIRKGIIIVKRRYIPYRKLSMVSIISPFYLFPFMAARVTADTDGGNERTADFFITISKKELAEIKQKVVTPFTKLNEIKRVYKPKNFYIAVLSLVVSNSLAGVLLISTFISGLGKLLGQEVESIFVGKLTELAEKVAFGVPPIAAYTALVVLGGWAISFLLNLFRHLRFCVIRKGGSLNIKGGIFTTREYLVTVKRINLIELRQSLITKTLRLYTAFIHCSGYGKGKDELSVLMPAGTKKDIMQNVRLTLPEIPLCAATVHPRIKYLSRFLIPPLSLTGITLALWLLTSWIFPLSSDIIPFFFIMALIPCLWYLAVKAISFFHTGVGQSDDVYTFYYTYGYRIKTVAIPKRRVISITVRRSLFQVMSGCCDLVVLSYSEGKKRHVIPNLEFDEARRIIGLIS